MKTGYSHQASQVLDKLLAIDPMQGNALNWRGIAAIDAGELDLAERLLLRSQDLGLAHTSYGLALLAEARGRRDEAVRLMTQALGLLGPELPPGSAEAIARGEAGDAQAREKALTLVDRYLATRPPVVTGAAPYALLRLGQTARALELLEAGPTGNDSLPLPALWGPYGRAARTSPAFREFAERAGLVDLWEREGAPDLCRRVGPRDYVCR